MITPREHFKAIFKRVQKTGCIVFRDQTSANKKYYPKIKRGGKQYKYTRYLWALTRGPIPDGMVIRHTCDNPACVNLNHLLLGTHADNVADRVARNRSARGEKNGRAKLTEQDVVAIREHPAENKSALARKYKVDSKVIHDIKAGRSWKHVTA